MWNKPDWTADFFLFAAFHTYFCSIFLNYGEDELTLKMGVSAEFKFDVHF